MDESGERGSLPIEGVDRVPVGPGEPALKSSFDPRRLDFGHYAGHSVEELATADPDYLHWLARHPSGIRYRSEISRVLGITLRSTEY
jgi:hypothetical protein